MTTASLDRPIATDLRPLGTVFVTGGASGLGAAVVAAVGAAGGTPAVLDRRPPVNGTVYGEVDLADPDAVTAAVDALVDRVGPPSAVVTAAGIDACGRLADVPAQEWERVVQVNLFGTVRVIRACLPALTAARGRIVTVASTLALRGVSDATAYCASKFAVRGFSHALAAELAGQVGVTVLVPGGMRTPFFDGRTEQYRPGPDADLADPRAVAGGVITALRQPPGTEIRELLIMPAGETSWP
ncbi:SDR family oxidoreductase [Nakamurella sp.]|uniref:SDR family oxidoreductase n=1 Tax=Nakamurella sp. TaxID=1869182 RepID=UPI003B3B7317